MRNSFNNCLNLYSAGLSYALEFTLKLLNQTKRKMNSLKQKLLNYYYLTDLCIVEPVDSHKKTRRCNFFHFGSILMIHANCNMNSDTTSNGLLFVGSNTFIGQTSIN